MCVQAAPLPALGSVTTAALVDQLRGSVSALLSPCQCGRPRDPPPHACAAGPQALLDELVRRWKHSTTVAVNTVSALEAQYAAAARELEAARAAAQGPPARSHPLALRVRTDSGDKWVSPPPCVLSRVTVRECVTVHECVTVRERVTVRHRVSSRLCAQESVAAAHLRLSEQRPRV